MLQTRAFFDQQREREAEGDGWTWPEGNDPISIMDRTISLKVSHTQTQTHKQTNKINTHTCQIFRSVGVGGLVASSRVCRSWRAIAGDPELWNKMDLSLVGDRYILTHSQHIIKNIYILLTD